jgi:hypothetical protein
MIRCLFLLFATFGAGFAQQPGTLLLALDGGLGDGVPEAIERFQPSTAEIPVVFLRSSADDPPPVADLFLDGDGLGAALASSLPFHAKASVHPLLLEGSFQFALPESSKPYLLRVRFRNARDTTGARVIGWVTMRTLPRNELREALSRWLKQEANEGIALFGECKGLRELLSSWRIPFEDLGQDPPHTAAHRFVIGSVRDLHQLVLPGKDSLLVLSADPELEGNRLKQSSNGLRALLVRAPESSDWRTAPRLHRLLCSELDSISKRHD